MYCIRTELGSFYAVDCNDYSYFSPNINKAYIFKSKEEAKKVLNNYDFTAKITMSNGYVYPPRLIQDAANICRSHPKASIQISIVEIKFEPVHSVLFTGEIKKAKS